MNARHKGRFANRDEDYQRLGISRDDVATWEDGARTDGRRGTYEWWHFDAHLEGGAKLVVTFLTKDFSAPDKPLSPMIRLNLDLPDGRSFRVIRAYRAEDYSSRRDGADVRIGRNTFTGDLDHYEIHVEIDDLQIDVTLDAEIRPWRPHTGCLVFDEVRDLEFSWLPAVPLGTVGGSYEIDGVRHAAIGVGHHDHNWGNVGMESIINDWYRATGQAGPYTVIASYITSHGKYGYEPVPVFMLAKDGEIVADDASLTRFRASKAYFDARTGKPVAAVTTYFHGDYADRYVVAFTKSRDLVADTFIERMKGLRRLTARLKQRDGAYHRFVGDVTVERWQGTTLVEKFANEASWELMYFGQPRIDEWAPVRPKLR
ncbi:hydroxyneurosporene dehydrogenase [Microbacterium sp. EST19A]|uniref:hydroxyneurosporene dehydrogenase n=1 Tax=Microbacterium sp. EST19A TaxID=2862681 RepID=UPI001CC0BCC7|nr:hydroxyneurosporene dehydrogenase [Microbacterium sp. EST19A]